MPYEKEIYNAIFNNVPGFLVILVCFVKPLGLRGIMGVTEAILKSHGACLRDHEQSGGSIHLVFRRLGRLCFVPRVT